MIADGAIAGPSRSYCDEGGVVGEAVRVRGCDWEARKAQLLGQRRTGAGRRSGLQSGRRPALLARSRFPSGPLPGPLSAPCCGLSVHFLNLDPPLRLHPLPSWPLHRRCWCFRKLPDCHPWTRARACDGHRRWRTSRGQDRGRLRGDAGRWKRRRGRFYHRAKRVYWIRIPTRKRLLPSCAPFVALRPVVGMRVPGWKGRKTRRGRPCRFLASRARAGVRVAVRRRGGGVVEVL